MRRTLKRIASWVLVPLTKWYLRKERAYSRAGIRVTVFPGVFHPGLFSSTGFLLEFLADQDLKDKSLLELGCGSGLLSIAAARAGARVTASDLNAEAIRNTKQNAVRNHVSIEIVHSDLFATIPSTAFDWIVINPPYYARTPRNDEDLAWYCGENFEYFERLFRQLGSYMHEDTFVVMVLTLGCDVQKILSMTKENNFRYEVLKEKPSFFDERDFLFRLRKED
ncbi:MAG TPA: methyltransferase [Cyclobacteriaceae bacterium]